MSHDNIIAHNLPKSRVISKSRVIAGLLAEMDAAGAVVMIRSSTDAVPISARIQCEFCVPFEKSTLKVNADGVLPGRYDAIALFAGQRITFELIVIDVAGSSAFPAAMTVVDLRRSRRRTFSPEIQTAEIWSRHAVVFATPIDFSQNSMALVSIVPDPPLEIGECVDIKIRGEGIGRDVFSFSMKVHDVEKNNLATRILLGFDNELSKPRQNDDRRTLRRDLSGISLCISPADGRVGEDVVCDVSNFSTTGLRCEIKDVTRGSWFIPGVHVKIQGSTVYGTVMWCSSSSIGIRLDALDDSNTLSSWMALLKQLAPDYTLHSSRVDQLISLFTESGLLKGSRRKIYGAKPGKFLPSELVTSNPLLYHRVSSSTDGARIIGQVSMVRLTDDFWFLQEGTHTGDSEGVAYDLLLEEIQRVAEDLASTSVLAPRYVGGLVHKAVKSSVNYLEKYMVNDRNGKFSLLQVAISANFKRTDPQMPLDDCQRLNALTAGRRRAVLSHFNPLISEIFGGLNGAHPRLNAELSKLGPNHKAETVVMESEGVVWGLVYRLRSYYSLSSTGVVNSLYFIIRAGTDFEIIREGMIRILGTPLLQGTDDLVLVVDSSDLKSDGELDGYFKKLCQEFPKGKEFTLYIIDCLLGRPNA